MDRHRKSELANVAVDVLIAHGEAIVKGRETDVSATVSATILDQQRERATYAPLESHNHR